MVAVGEIVFVFFCHKLDVYNILVFYKGKYWYFTTDHIHQRQLILNLENLINIR